MSFSDAMVFIAAILIIVGSGALLGYSLRGGRRERHASDQLLAGKAALYAELAQSIDGLDSASYEHKHYFMQRYYQSLVYASDEVLLSLNTFLDTDAGESPTAKEQARDSLLMSMRADIQYALGEATSISTEALYKIELKRNEARTNSKQASSK